MKKTTKKYYIIYYFLVVVFSVVLCSKNFYVNTWEYWLFLFSFIYSNLLEISSWKLIFLIKLLTNINKSANISI